MHDINVEMNRRLDDIIKDTVKRGYCNKTFITDGMKSLVTEA
jgi:hypothetical protein